MHVLYMPCGALLYSFSFDTALNDLLILSMSTEVKRILATYAACTMYANNVTWDAEMC